MSDIDHFYSADLNLSATGDLGAVDGDDMSQQRVLRRLLTNPAYTDIDGTLTPADYLFHPDYGAGLARFIGSTASLGEIRAVIQEQLALEAAVAQTPAPVVNLAWRDQSTLACVIQYYDANSGAPVVLSFDVNQ
jgi:hypothetical protein